MEIKDELKELEELIFSDEHNEESEDKTVDPRCCTLCGGFGFDDKICPMCGTDKSKKKTIDLNNRKDRNKFIDRCERNAIPNEYIGVEWSKELLLNDHPEYTNNFGFRQFTDMMETILNIFISGQIPNKSFFLSAPAKCSKVTWAYSCMQIALDKGFKVARLLDSQELKRLVVLSSENVNYKLYGVVNYDEYMLSDVLFITLTKTSYMSESINTIIELIDRRSRLGLPVFIISRYSLDELDRFDGRHLMKNLKDNTKFNNDYKYPAILEFVDTGFGKKRGDR